MLVWQAPHSQSPDPAKAAPSQGVQVSLGCRTSQSQDRAPQRKLKLCIWAPVLVWPAVHSQSPDPCVEASSQGVQASLGCPTNQSQDRAPQLWPFRLQIESFAKSGDSGTVRFRLRSLFGMRDYILTNNSSVFCVWKVNTPVCNISRLEHVWTCLSGALHFQTLPVSRIKYVFCSFCRHFSRGYWFHGDKRKNWFGRPLTRSIIRTLFVFSLSES